MNINSLSVLYVVSTPIGNLQDISLRAVEILKSVHYIIAEDTRHSQALLQYFSIKTKTIALHEHNERERTLNLIERLQQGESVALISDAGTPLISDPGYYLVREVRSVGIKVVPIPGACAAIAALSVAGLPTDRFVFEGFLPVKAGARLQRLQKLQSESRTLIFYESPHRITDFLSALCAVFGGERNAVIAREMTKLFETIRSDKIKALISWMAADPNQQRGEFVIIVEGAKQDADDKQVETLRILTILLNTLSLKQAVDLTSQITAQKKNDIYEIALRIKKNNNPD
jgi:16S rRNA (cytidine1402-2'-O)-methyltransferase